MEFYYPSDAGSKRIIIDNLTYELLIEDGKQSLKDDLETGQILLGRETKEDVFVAEGLIPNWMCLKAGLIIERIKDCLGYKLTWNTELLRKFTFPHTNLKIVLCHWHPGGIETLGKVYCKHDMVFSFVNQIVVAAFVLDRISREIRINAFGGFTGIPVYLGDERLSLFI